MSSMDDPEQRLAEALRARAGQTAWSSAAPSPQQQSAGYPRTARTGDTRPHPGPSRSPMAQVGLALLVAFLAGVALGCVLALLSVLVPGLLPPLG